MRELINALSSFLKRLEIDKTEPVDGQTVSDTEEAWGNVVAPTELLNILDHELINTWKELDGALEINEELLKGKLSDSVVLKNF